MIHREDWTHVAAGASPYLQYDHLLALEDAMKADGLPLRDPLLRAE